MTMQFCDKCGKIMKVQEHKDSGKIVLQCHCGFEKPFNSAEHNISSTENIPPAPEVGKGAVDSKNELAGFPHLCKKCGYDLAQVIDLGVWFSDEAGVIRYKCGKCGFTEQDKESNT